MAELASPVIATVTAATTVQPSAFAGAHEVSACLGLARRQHSTGGKAGRSGILKSRYLARLIARASVNLLRSIKTRESITITAVMIALSTTAHAQQTADVPQVCVLAAESLSSAWASRYAGFIDGLHDLGY